MRTRMLAVFLALFASLALAGDKGFNPPPAGHAKTYPLLETHDDEKVSIAVDSFERPPKSSVFHAKYRESGFLVLRLIISNDGDAPRMLDSLKVHYITAHRDKLDPASTDDVVRRISHPSRPDTRARVPLPIPGSRKTHGNINRETLEELESANFLCVPVTPHSTHSGFLFFDIQDIDSPKEGAHLYISGIKAGTKELFYFDLPLSEAETPAPAASPSPSPSRR